MGSKASISTPLLYLDGLGFSSKDGDKLGEAIDT